MKNDLFKFERDIDNILENYFINAEQVFKNLKDKLSFEIKPEEFDFYRINYFYRTNTTIPCIAKLIISSHYERDLLSLTLAGKNLNEETGSGIINHVHPYLLEFSHNTLASKIFKLKKINLKDVESSELVTETTKNFRLIQDKLYSSKKHIEVVSVNFAQETVATHMLASLKKIFFEPYKEQFVNSTYYNIVKYFSCHINGLEQEHAENARNALVNLIANGHDTQTALSAIKEILDAQYKMWLSWESEIKK